MDGGITARVRAMTDCLELQFVMRCIVTRTDQPVEDANRPVAVGSWDQIRDDARTSMT